MHKVVGDSVLPQYNSENSPGRDVQCELFVGVLCARARLAPIFQEPDLYCTLTNQTVGVAIKRLKAPPDLFDERFKERICNARDQIEKSMLPGVIVADVSQSLNPTGWRVPLEVSDSKFDAVWQTQRDRLKTRVESRLLEWTRGKSVRGVILLNHILRCRPTREWCMELFGSSINLSAFNQRRRREFERFSTLFGNACCNPGKPFSALRRS